MEVIAWANGVKCGDAITQLIDGQVVYAIKISEDSPVTPGCGKEGGLVYFQVGGHKMVSTAHWNNDRVWYMSLTSRLKLYLPLMGR